MSELESKTEAEVEAFNDELSDEALDREGGIGPGACVCSSRLCHGDPVTDR